MHFEKIRQHQTESRTKSSVLYVWLVHHFNPRFCFCISGKKVVCFKISGRDGGAGENIGIHIFSCQKIDDGVHKKSRGQKIIVWIRPCLAKQYSRLKPLRSARSAVLRQSFCTLHRRLLARQLAGTFFRSFVVITFQYTPPSFALCVKQADSTHTSDVSKTSLGHARFVSAVDPWQRLLEI